MRDFEIIEEQYDFSKIDWQDCYMAQRLRNRMLLDAMVQIKDDFNAGRYSAPQLDTKHTSDDASTITMLEGVAAIRAQTIKKLQGEVEQLRDELKDARQSEEKAQHQLLVVRENYELLKKDRDSFADDQAVQFAQKLSDVLEGAEFKIKDKEVELQAVKHERDAAKLELESMHVKEAEFQAKIQQTKVALEQKMRAVQQLLFDQYDGAMTGGHDCNLFPLRRTVSLPGGPGGAVSRPLPAATPLPPAARAAFGHSGLIPSAPSPASSPSVSFFVVCL